MRQAISVSEYMTEMPHGISPNETVAAAKKRMEELKVRHMPVRDGGKVIGILTERDLYYLSRFPNIDLTMTSVESAMTPDPFCVAAMTPLSVVAHEMTERRIGSALVVDDEDHLLGIFTETDALSALAEEFKPTAKHERITHFPRCAKVYSRR